MSAVANHQACIDLCNSIIAANLTGEEAANLATIIEAATAKAVDASGIEAMRADCTAAGCARAEALRRMAAECQRRVDGASRMAMEGGAACPN
jgi:hypothetical protein